MQAIITKYHGPTNTKGSRISASCQAGRLYMHYDHALNIGGNHAQAARFLAEKLGWTGAHYSPLASGCLPSGDYAHVFIPREYVQARDAVFMTRYAVTKGDLSGNPHAKAWCKAIVALTDAADTIYNDAPFMLAYSRYKADRESTEKGDLE